VGSVLTPDQWQVTISFIQTMCVYKTCASECGAFSDLRLVPGDLKVYMDMCSWLWDLFWPQTNDSWPLPLHRPCVFTGRWSWVWGLFWPHTNDSWPLALLRLCVFRDIWYWVWC